MSDEKYIAARIRELRKNAGMDVDTVGAGVGRSGKTVSAWETGRNVPSAEMLITICRFFGVSISYFYPPDVVDEGNRNEVILDTAERELLSLWRRMDESQQSRIIADMRDFALANDAKKESGDRDGDVAGVAVS